VFKAQGRLGLIIVGTVGLAIVDNGFQSVEEKRFVVAGKLDQQ
jgi:hypothetical protein